MNFFKNQTWYIVFWYTNDPQNPYDFKLGGETTSLVTKDSENDYVIEEDSIRNVTRRYIRVARLLDTGDSDDVAIDFNSNELEIMYSWGSSSLELNFHGSNYGTVILDLTSGGGSLKTVETEYEGFQDSEHAILMIMAFGVLMPMSTFIKRYALRFEICWFSYICNMYAYMHKYTLQLHRGLASLGYFLAIVGFFIKLAALHGDIKRSLHARIGMLLLFFIGIYSLLSWLYCFKSAMDYNHSTIRVKTEFRLKYLHNITGYVFVIAGMFNIYLGLDKSNYHAGYLYAYCIYALLFWGAFAACECAKNILRKGKGESNMFEIALVEKKSLIEEDQFANK
ncbi:hypothetical protein RFI_03122 [Reticulomyxa filosa]|uniref:Cytochrome b561 domain-containing protein n=1 Tax=Reticulomyxa filosa TaxID=46433 RepID=X6P7D8_RETFI|nr:hypothetical protein RFI_03122 [Reticulomyxa filosa]|eukprot:ETO33974.1 hypothetical protein RFI_03122 [Reticulomyxa filosa]